MRSILSISCLVTYSCLAIQHGDEKFESIYGGLFYTFCDGDESHLPSVDIVDPNTMRVLKSISAPNGTTWADATYVETCEANSAQLILVGDRGRNKIHIIDTSIQELVKEINMSIRPVHTYAIPSRQEFWAHSDGDGVFDVIHYGLDHGKLYHEDIIAYDNTPGHGKLLWDDDLMPYAYASNTREGVVYEYDMRLSPPSIVRYTVSDNVLRVSALYRKFVCALAQHRWEVSNTISTDESFKHFLASA